MKKLLRYRTSHLIEDQFEPGSRGRVIINKLGITSARAMAEREKEAQLRALEKLVDFYQSDHRFTADDICYIHKTWLSDIYEWAGRYRQVKMDKDGFPFAYPEQIPKLMTEFEKAPLRQFTPCRFKSLEEVIKALAIVHAELVFIHPFREGNGRVARMLATLMALQAGLPPLDFSGITGKKKKEYIEAIHAGFQGNYEPMGKIFESVIRRTLWVRGRK
jgi:cell filamentation protein